MSFYLVHSFKQNATRVSRLIKDQPRTPLELTGDWIEYVLRHNGAPHLRIEAFNMPWYQEYLIDVGLFLFTVIACALACISLCCKFVCNKCCGSDGPKAKKEWQVERQRWAVKTSIIRTPATIRVISSLNYPGNKHHQALIPVSQIWIFITVSTCTC